MDAPPTHTWPRASLVWSKRRTSGLESFRFRGEARGDGERGVDERDLHVAIPLGLPLDERQGGEDPFGVGEVLSRGAGWLWCAVHGPDLIPVKARRSCSLHSAGPLNVRIVPR